MSLLYLQLVSTSHPSDQKICYCRLHIVIPFYPYYNSTTVTLHVSLCWQTYSSSVALLEVFSYLSMFDFPYPTQGSEERGCHMLYKL